MLQAKDCSAAITNSVDAYLAELLKHGDNTSCPALAQRRKDVHAINQSNRSARRFSGAVSHEIHFGTDDGPSTLVPGDRLLFTRIHSALGVTSGALGTVESVERSALEVNMDAEDGRTKQRLRLIPPSSLALTTAL